MSRNMSLMRRERAVLIIAVTVMAIGVASCKKKLTATGPDGEAIVAQSEHARKVEVTVQAKVDRMLADDSEGLPHERFLLKLSNGTTVLVAHDTQFAKRVPLEAGDTVRIHGEYIWNQEGGVIHWTHRSDSPRHEGGWIEFDGEKYQ